MFEQPKHAEKSESKNAPIPAKFCGVKGCHRKTVVYIKAYDVSRCAECYQQDSDDAGKSASQSVTCKAVNGKSSNKHEHREY